MRGPSRAALAEARQRLADAMTSAAVARTLGEELFGILGVLDEQAGLRRALTDSSRRAQARAELARTLFGSQVSEATLDLFTSMCESRWSRPADLPDAVEEVAVTAFAAAAERARHLDDLEDQLFRFGRVVMAAPELRTVLSNPTVPAQHKRQLLDTLLEGKVAADARQLIGEAAEHTRGRSVDYDPGPLRAVDSAVAPAPHRGSTGGHPAHRTPARAADHRARGRVRARGSPGRHRRSSRRGWHFGPDRG